VNLGRKGAIGGIVCLVGLSAAACSGGSASEVTVATAARGTIATDAGGQGTVAAGVDVPIALTVTDQVEGVNVLVGQHVSKGQTLLTVNPQPLLGRTAQLQAHLQHEESDLTHLQADVAAGRTAAALLPAMHDQEQTLQSQVILYSQLVGMAKGQKGTITSPIDGQVLAVNVRAGQITKSASTLVEIVDYHRITVTAELPVSAQPEVDPGDPARLTFAAVPGVAVTGTVSGVSPGAVNSGTGFEVTVDAPNAAGLQVHPGYQAYVQVSYRSQGGAVVRLMAVLNIDLAPTIFVVQGDTVWLRRVQVGAQDGSDVQIVSGVQPGEHYVLVGDENLASGDHVHVTGNAGALGGTSG